MKRILFVFSLLLVGCASSGVQVKQEQVAAFKEGVTTEAEVVQALGNPTGSTTSSDGTKMIVYSSANYRTRPASFIPIVGLFAGGADMEMTSTIFTFDKEGKMLTYRATQSKYGSP